MNKEIARKRRARKSKAVILASRSCRPRIVVYRSNTHISCQIIVPGENGDVVLVSASTIDKEIRTSISGKKKDQALQVGKLLAARAKEKQIVDVAFDRSGYSYHGRVKALAYGARDGGLNF